MSNEQGERIRFCSQCGADMPFDETTCPACGHVEGGWPAPEGPSTACGSCGGEVPAGRCYCPHCAVPTGAASDLIPAVDVPVRADEPDGAGREAFARTIVLVAPTLLLGALALALLGR